MNTFALRVFQREVAFQCDIALEAGKVADDTVISLVRNGDNSDETKTNFWGAIQLILMAAANVAKLIWPTRTPRGYPVWHNDRADVLRDSLGVTDAWLLKSKDLRNAFEHYDEYLDRIGSSDNPQRIIIDRVIGPTTMIKGVSTFSLYRSYNPHTGVLHLWDKEVDLGDLLAELRTLVERARAEAAKPLFDATD